MSTDSLPGRALDLHWGISTPPDLEAAVSYLDPYANGCQRWPEGMWLVNDFGEMVRGRCKATNLCAYCARIFAVETSEMMALDAMEGNAPQVWAVLTTRTVTRDVSAFYLARSKVQRAIRRRWPAAEFAWFLEFTTGYGPRSGGKRRPHWNLLIKGVLASDVAEIEALVQRIWCSHVDALPRNQYVGAVEEVGGLMRYLALHFLKESQQPPKGWHGHRFTTTHGYFPISRTLARAQARESLQGKRELWKSLQAGLEGQEAEDHVREVMEARCERSWNVVWLGMHRRNGTLRSTGHQSPGGNRNGA